MTNVDCSICVLLIVHHIYIYNVVCTLNYKCIMYLLIIFQTITPTNSKY